MTAQENGTKARVEACPSCDTWSINSRDDGTYHCNECGTDFDEPVIRPQHGPRGRPLLAAQLAAMDPDDFHPDRRRSA